MYGSWVWFFGENFIELKFISSNLKKNVVNLKDKRLLFFILDADCKDNSVSIPALYNWEAV